eukprot:1036989-Prorocentrum_minimum.AAC.2
MGSKDGNVRARRKTFGGETTTESGVEQRREHSNEPRTVTRASPGRGRSVPKRRYAGVAETLRVCGVTSVSPLLSFTSSHVVCLCMCYVAHLGARRRRRELLGHLRLQRRLLCLERLVRLRPLAL